MKANSSIKEQNDAKKLFRKLGSCSHTFFHILNREYGHTKRIEERASDPLAGGIYQQGYQCGMLWGSSLAVGAEAFRRYKDHDKAISVAIKATQHVMESFTKRTDTIECYDITNCDWSSKISMAKYFFTGKFLSCFTLAEEWAPEAVDAAEEGLAEEWTDLSQECLSCASEVAKRMGASDEHVVMVAGFAGGLGLSGNACGALSAAIWMKNFDRCKKSEKSSYKDPDSDGNLEKFYAATDYEIQCDKITGRTFKTVEDHTEFIKNGGCDKLINTLSQL
jgi:hypothetical protein